MMNTKSVAMLMMVLMVLCEFSGTCARHHHHHHHHSPSPSPSPDSDSPSPSPSPDSDSPSPSPFMDHSNKCRNSRNGVFSRKRNILRTWLFYSSMLSPRHKLKRLGQVRLMH
ncbi:PREDICTED: early nodulin-55-1-like [Camelina sativa]|uniref:Early nodulin-55-1-like n=1 Tax=Camelina sativa TaxID=90675 RepID=A0ABM1RH91_CAMSA|nr:PREDICTED: early nodulin-55-1-like [Camelina sativa]